MKKTQLIILVLVFYLPSLGQVESGKFQKLIDSLYSDDVERINVKDAGSKLDSFIVLDTRSHAEYEVSHISNAYFVDYENFSPIELDSLSREQDILVYCSIGVRSEEIGKQLLGLGFNNVYNLEGGIFEWKNQGHDVYSDSGESTDTVHVYSRLWGYWMKNGIKLY